MPGDGVPSDHLRCTACGYDLRLLGDTRQCPECGQSVAVSEHDHAVARPRWLRSVGLGSLLIGTGLLVGGAGILISFWPPLASLLWRRGIDQRTALWLLPVGAVTGAAGTWRFAAPTPRVAGSHGRWRATILRVVAVCTCALQLQLFLLTIAALRGVLMINAATLAFCARSLLVVWGAAAGLTCLRAAYVAREVRDRSGAVQAWMLALFAPLTLLAFAASTNTIAAGRWSRMELIAWSACGSVIAGWSAVFFGAFAVIVRRAAGITAVGVKVPNLSEATS
jgi:hypothetical protein